MKSKDRIPKVGDNIYKPIKGGEFIQKPSMHSDPDGNENLNKKEHDLKGKSVLVSNEFSYFGKPRNYCLNSQKSSQPEDISDLNILRRIIKRKYFLKRICYVLLRSFQKEFMVSPVRGLKIKNGIKNYANVNRQILQKWSRAGNPLKFEKESLFKLCFYRKRLKAKIGKK